VTIAIPETSTELEELLNDASRLKAVAKEGKLGELVSAYARHQMEAKSGDLAARGTRRPARARPRPRRWRRACRTR